MAEWGFLGGFLRLSFSFSIGLLMSRNFKKFRIRGAFWICSALILAILSCPYISTNDNPSILNAVYDCICTLIAFPAIVYIGACGTTTDKISTKLCDFSGKLSYPIYIIHYPVMYLFYAWIWNNGLNFDSVWPVCTGIFLGLILFAWAVMKWYDEPVRNWLTHLFSRRLSTRR